MNPTRTDDEEDEYDDDEFEKPNKEESGVKIVTRKQKKRDKVVYASMQSPALNRNRSKENIHGDDQSDSNVVISPSRDNDGGGSPRAVDYRNY